MQLCPTVVFGAGGLGRELFEMAQRQPARFGEMMGFVDDTPALQGTSVLGLPVLGGIGWLLAREEPLNVLVGLGYPAPRRAVVGRLSQNAALLFPAVVAAEAYVSPSATLGRGCYIAQMAVVAPGVRLGDFCLLNYGCTVGHDCGIANFATVSPGAHLAGYARIGEGADIGTGANVLPNKTVGEHAVVGAGATVTKDIPANCVSVGVPAVPVRFFEPDHEAGGQDTQRTEG